MGEVCAGVGKIALRVNQTRVQGEGRQRKRARVVCGKTDIEVSNETVGFQLSMTARGKNCNCKVKELQLQLIKDGTTNCNRVPGGAGRLSASPRGRAIRMLA